MDHRSLFSTVATGATPTDIDERLLQDKQNYEFWKIVENVIFDCLCYGTRRISLTAPVASRNIFAKAANATSVHHRWDLEGSSVTTGYLRLAANQGSFSPKSGFPRFNDKKFKTLNLDYHIS